MLTMTDYETPKFPAVPTPEDMKAASEKVMNFWVGAMSPMWVPFWAASSFGLSAWAMTQNMAKSEGLMKDMPQLATLAPKWPGFGSVWGANTPSEVLEETKAAAKPVVEATEKAVKQGTKTVAKAAEKAVDDASAAVVQAVEAIPEPEMPKVAFDPVIEAPVAIEQAAVEAPAVLVEAAQEAIKEGVKPAPKTVVAKVTPKPIAKAVSAVKPKKT